MKLEELFEIIQDRKKKMPKGSYPTSLFTDGLDKIVQKVGEEAIEVVIAAKGTIKQRVIEELADLWYHCLVLMASWNITLDDVLKELEKRQKGATMK